MTTVSRATAGPVLHPFEPGLHQRGELADVALGQVYLTQWHPGMSAPAGDGGTRWAYAGVGRK